MCFALGDKERFVFRFAGELVDEPICFVDASAPVAIPVSQRFGLADTGIAVAFNVFDESIDPLEGLFVFKLPAGIFIPGARRKGDGHKLSPLYASISSRICPSPRSSERIDSASTRWLASDQKGSGHSVTTSNGKRWRMTDWRRKRRIALDISSPAFVKRRSASLRRPLSIRICSVDVAILHSFVVQNNGIIAKSLFRNKVEANRWKEILGILGEDPKKSEILIALSRGLVR